MEKIFKSFCSISGAPERFIETQQDLSVKFKESTKDLYDLSRNNGLEQIDSALPELIIQNFDDEQIWQELELQSEPSMQELVDVVSKLSASKELTFETVEKQESDNVEADNVEEMEDQEYEDEEEVEDENEDMSDDDDIEEEGKGFHNVLDSDASDEERELEALLQKAQAMPIDDDYDDEDDDGEDDDGENDDDDEQDDDDADVDLESNKKTKTSEQSKASSLSKKRSKSVVDDKFFSLSDMAEFLEQEDAREERKIQRENKGADQDQSSEEEEDLDDDQEDEAAFDIKYTDFFDPPPNAEKADKKKKKGVSFNMEEDEEEEGEEEEGEEESEEGEKGEDEEMDQSGAGMNKDLFDDSDEGEDLADIFGGAKSSFENRQARLKEKIKDYEEKAVGDKPWQLKGEITAMDRPENSLLQEDLDFDSNARAAPAITEETTKTLEDIIRQRIQDKVWDDVERKKKTEDVFEFKKKVVLDTEKSKMSLSQVYEEEYIKQQQADEDEKEDPKHESIQKSMQALFVKLDALSNFHFSPKPAAPDIKIVSNLPSIAMEEALPVAASEATTLAPEQIKDKKKEELKGDSEKTKTDKLRDRRKKKNRQGAYFEEKDKKAKKVAALNPNSKVAKKKAVGDVQKLAKTSSNVALMKEKEQVSLTSSSKFFSQLQDQVSSHIAAKKTQKASKDIDKNKKSSSKLKL